MNPRGGRDGMDDGVAILSSTGHIRAITDRRENLAILTALPPLSIVSLQGQAFLAAISTV